MRRAHLLALLAVVLAGSAALLLTALGGGGGGTPTDVLAANPCLSIDPEEIARESRRERGGEVEGEAREEGEEHGSEAEEARMESCALNEPSDVMLTRQLFGSDKGLTPTEVRASAQRDAQRLAIETRAAAPAVASAQWRLEGPTNIGGRVLDVAIDPERQDTIFIATASGGVWKSTDAGTTFAPVWPASQNQAVGALTISPSGVLYAGTGETGPGGGSITYGGDGVYRSTDRGETWQRIGLENTARISRIVIDPANEDKIFVAASGDLFEGSEDRGLYLSEDGGDSWAKVLAGETENTGATDVAVNETDPSIVWATTWEHRRTPDQRLYEGEGSGVYKSTDGGHTFERVSSPGFGPDPQLGRIGITLGHGEEGKDLVYVITTRSSGVSGGVYKSTDGGDTFTPTYDVDFTADGSFVYGWWFGRIWVDPKDNDHDYVAGVGLLESTDGGLTFDVQPYGSNEDLVPHADQHAMAWDPKVPDRVYLGNDGGLYRSDENGASETWHFATYQPFTQPYTMDVSEQDPKRMVAGFQDNGANRSFGEEEGEWNEYVGGDGQRTLIKPTDQDLLYGCYQYGECAVSYDAGENADFFTERVVSARKNWTTPIEFDPEDPSTIYTGGEVMNMSEDDAQTFVPISPDLSNGPGKETNPLFRNYGTLTTIAPAGKSKGTIYAGTDDGNLWYTHDQSDPSAWTKADDPDLPGAWITRVEVSKSNPNVAYVSYSGFRSGDNAAYLLRTTDGGENWDDVTGDLPEAPINDVNIVGDAVFVAGDFGVFVSRDAGATWLKVGANLPNAPVFELRYHAPTNRLYAGVFGRSIWSIALADLEEVPAQDGPPAEIRPEEPGLTPPAPPAPTRPSTRRSRRQTRLGLPTASRCLRIRRGRTLRFRVRGIRKLRLQRYAVFLNDELVAYRKGRRRMSRTVVVRDLPSAFRLRIVATTRGGRVLQQTRRYRRCRRARG